MKSGYFILSEDGKKGDMLAFDLATGIAGKVQNVEEEPDQLEIPGIPRSSKTNPSAVEILRKLLDDNTKETYVWFPYEIVSLVGHYELLLKTYWGLADDHKQSILIAFRKEASALATLTFTSRKEEEAAKKKLDSHSVEVAETKNVSRGESGVDGSRGIKNDGNKDRLDLLSPSWLSGVGKVLSFGAVKYAAHNWRKGIERSRLLGACLRHVFAYLGGEDNDPETGLLHLHHASCCLMFASELHETHPELDDRWKPRAKLPKSLDEFAKVLDDPKLSHFNGA